MIIAGIESIPLRIPFKAGTGLVARQGHDGPGIGRVGRGLGFRAVASPSSRSISSLRRYASGRRDPDRPADAGRAEEAARLRTCRGPRFGISAVDIALWDIAGKAAKRPLCQLLWAAARPISPVMRAWSVISAPFLVRRSVRQAIAAGFGTLKLHEIELSAVRAAREEVGADIELTLDVNCPWTLNEARPIAEQLKAVRLKWLEEPLWPPENFDGLAELRRTSGIPIAAGENVYALMDFERMLAAKAVDFVQPSPPRWAASPS